MLAQNDALKDPSGGILRSCSGKLDSHFTSRAANASVSEPSAARRGLNSPMRMSPTGHRISHLAYR